MTYSSCGEEQIESSVAYGFDLVWTRKMAILVLVLVTNKFLFLLDNQGWEEIRQDEAIRRKANRDHRLIVIVGDGIILHLECKVGSYV